MTSANNNKTVGDSDHVASECLGDIRLIKNSNGYSKLVGLQKYRASATEHIVSTFFFE